MRNTITLLSLCLLACVAKKDRDAGLTSAPISQPVKDQVAPLNYEFLKAMVVDNDLVSIDELLEAVTMSDEGKELLGNAAFVFAGTGDIHSSKDAPRVILFNRDASLIISYGTDTPSDEQDSLQIISYDPSRQTFDFREILFPAADFGGAIAFEDGASNGDANRCASCHATDSRPIWEKPPVWPGIYGGVGQTIKPATEEYEGFRGILSFASLNERFQHLHQLRSNFDKDLFDRPENITLQIEGRNANDVFHERVTRLNSRRISRLLGATEDHSQYRRAILSALLDCEDLYTEQIPDREVTRMGVDWEETLADTEAHLEEYHSNKLASLDGFGVSVDAMTDEERLALTKTSLPKTARTITRLRGLLEKRGKSPVDMTDWSTTPNPSYTFLVHQGTSFDLAGYYFMQHFHNDPLLGDRHQEIGERHGFVWEPAAMDFNRNLTKNRAAICDELD